MSQRGGSVRTHVRWGTEVKSPVIGRGEADYLVALEKLEALRYAPMLRPSGTVLVGALSTLIDSVPLEAWLEVVEERVPAKYIELNRQAFKAGRQARLSQL